MSVWIKKNVLFSFDLSYINFVAVQYTNKNDQQETSLKPLLGNFVNNNKEEKIEDDDIDIDEKMHKENPYENSPILILKNKPIADFAVTNLDKKILENSRHKDDGFKEEYAVCSLTCIIHL